jgi:CHAT domain-containing protein
VLVIANPAFDRARFPDLPLLPGADAEADAILSVFPDATVLRGKDATKSAFLRLAPQYDIVHFAGHAVVDEAHPEYSALILAPEPETGDSGALYAHEMAELDLHKTRLVVLAGCNTARGSVNAAEGRQSLARALLLGGAEEVMASNAAVPDDSSAVIVYDSLRSPMSARLRLSWVTLGISPNHFL